MGENSIMNFSFYSHFAKMARERGIEKTAEFALEKGFNSVEFFEIAKTSHETVAKDVQDAKRIKKVLDSYGLNVACYSLETVLIGEEGPDAEAALMKNAQLAAELGSPFLHHTLAVWLSLPPNAPCFDDAFNEAADRATRIAEYCKTLGVTCLYEEQGMYINGVDNFGKFYKEMKSRVDNVGVCGDVGNILFADEKPEDFFAAYKADMVHVHLKDYVQKRELTQADLARGDWLTSKGGNRLLDVKLGDGVVDFEKCFAYLKEVGYNGAYALEVAQLDFIDDGIAFAKKLLEK